VADGVTTTGTGRLSGRGWQRGRPDQRYLVGLFLVGLFLVGLFLVGLFLVGLFLVGFGLLDARADAVGQGRADARGTVAPGLLTSP
jgi:hypothetical protein